MTREFRHGYAHTNGIRMHYVEQGDGPLVLLCHGWPESWYSWRHQIPGAGHSIQQERPTEVNELLTRFLTEQVATGAMR
jgi:pimeloyl-ACP methyl ester carboxylesterase